MKSKIYSFLCGKIYIFLALTTLYFGACESLSIKEEKNVKLIFQIDRASLYSYNNSSSHNGAPTKLQIIDYDTNKFILSIYSANGAKIYRGKYSDRPKDLLVTPGDYDISLHSIDFKSPAFNAPLIGEEKTILVSSNQTVNIEFSCKQLNSAIALSFSSDFKNKFKGNGLKIVQNDKYLDYSYSENRYVYLTNEPFYLVYNNNYRDTTLLERRLYQGQMLSLNLSYTKSSSKGNSFKVEVDTTRTWINGNYNLGMNIPTGAVSIEEAKRMVGEKKVMVFGYIYGGDPTNVAIRIAPPFTSRTTIVIAPSTSERNRNNCFVVELPTGTIRDNLNLVVNYNLLGAPIVITGDIVDSYYGYIGIKNTKDYKII